MRDRLIELFKKNRKRACNNLPCLQDRQDLQSCKYSINDSLCNHIERQVDYLLANGVVVPPCKVGDKVYVINEWEVEETAVFSMKIESEDSGWVVFLKARVTDYAIKSKDGYASIFKTFIFGKTVFLTKEEAERALKGGE